MDNKRLHYFALVGMQNFLIDYFHKADEIDLDFKNISNIKWIQEQINEYVALAEKYRIDAERLEQEAMDEAANISYDVPL